MGNCGIKQWLKPLFFVWVDIRESGKDALRRDGQSWRESADARDGSLCSRDKIDTHFLCHRETDRRALQSNDLKLPLRASRMSHFVLDGRMTWMDVAECHRIINILYLYT